MLPLFQLEEAFLKQQQDELAARQAEKERVERERIEARKRREVQRITEVGLQMSLLYRIMQTIARNKLKRISTRHEEFREQIEKQQLSANIVALEVDATRGRQE